MTELARAVVTGATGFVGSRLVSSLLRDGVEVVASSRSPHGRNDIQWLHLDLPSRPPPDVFKNVDVVFHLAAHAHAIAAGLGDQYLYERVNVEGTSVLARAAADSGVGRFVLLSSVKAMHPPSSMPILENDLRFPKDPYGLSKRHAELVAEAIALSSGMDLVIVRPVLVYGPGAKGNLAALMDRLILGRYPPLPDVHNRRSLIGLVDLVEALIISAVHPAAAGQTYVLTDGEIYSSRRIIDALARAAGVKSQPRITIPVPALRLAARAGDLATKLGYSRVPFNSDLFERLLGNAEYQSDKVRDELQFRPSVTLEDEAAAIVSAHRSHMQRL